MKTKRLANGDLLVPMFDGDKYEWEEPVVFKGTLLGAMFSDQELKSLAIVKINCRFEDSKDEAGQAVTADDAARKKGDELNSFTFPDGTSRSFGFSSDNNFFMGSPELVEQLQQFFKTNLEAACTHGSLLTSDCYAGMQEMQGLRVKVVDFSDPQQLDFGTNDCFGLCSPKVAGLLDNPGDRPFQFRLGYKAEWSEQQQSKGRGKKPKKTQTNAPSVSFVAKGVLQPQANLEQWGCDLILDRSSIKGLNKGQLDTLLPCGDYVLPQAVLGNRQNGQYSEAALCWEFTAWFTPEAIRKDLAAVTREAALELADLQGNPLVLHKWMIEQLEGKVQLDEAGNPIQRAENAWLELLKVDTQKHLCHDRKFMVKAQEMLQEAWRSLATRSAFEMRSGMAVPVPDLPEGCVCIPGLKDGAEVIISRYPIINSDAIRTAKNVHIEGWSSVRGIVGVHPDDCPKFQADFDGDMMIFTPAKNLPNIAKECLPLEDGNRFKQIQKFPKRSYFAALNEEGKPEFPTLAHVGVGAARGRMAMVCWWIGQVQDGQPAPGENLQEFAAAKKVLLEELFQAMQVEVDRPKSAMKFEDIPGFDTLKTRFELWAAAHPSPFFANYKKENVYKLFSIPTHTKGALYVLPDVVNPLWEEVKLRLPNLQATQYLAKPILEQYSKDELMPLYQWAEDLRSHQNEALAELRSQELESNQMNKAIGNLYESMRAQIDEEFTNPQERLLRAAVLWDVCHRGDSTRAARECAELAEGAYPYMTIEPVQFPGKEYDEKHRYVIQVPMCKPDQGKDPLHQMRDQLLEAGIPFKAVVHANNPVVGFILDVPCPYGAGEQSLNTEKPQPEMLAWEKNPAVLDLIKDYTGKTFPNFEDKQTKQPAVYPDFAWVINPYENRRGTGSLAYNLLHAEVQQLISQYQPEITTVTGLRYNDYQSTDMDQLAGKTGRFIIAQMELPPDHFLYERYNGAPLLCSVTKGGNFAMGVFADQSAKLPIGTQFNATIQGYVPNSRSSAALAVQPESIKIPEVLTPRERKEQQRLAELETRRAQRSKGNRKQRNRDQGELAG